MSSFFWPKSACIFLYRVIQSLQGVPKSRAKFWCIFWYHKMKSFQDPEAQVFLIWAKNLRHAGYGPPAERTLQVARFPTVARSRHLTMNISTAFQVGCTPQIQIRVICSTHCLYIMHTPVCEDTPTMLEQLQVHTRTQTTGQLPQQHQRRRSAQTQT